MFGCWLYFTVVEKDGEATFEKFFELPFAPFSGLEIHFEGKDQDGRDCSQSFEIDRVEWSTNHEVFWLESNFECDGSCPCTKDDDCCTLTDWFKTMESLGFALDDSPRYGTDRLHRFDGMFDPELTYLGAIRAKIAQEKQKP